MNAFLPFLAFTAHFSSNTLRSRESMSVPELNLYSLFQLRLCEALSESEAVLFPEMKGFQATVTFSIEV